MECSFYFAARAQQYGRTQNTWCKNCGAFDPVRSQISSTDLSNPSIFHNPNAAKCPPGETLSKMKMTPASKNNFGSIQINARHSVMRVGITHICSNFLDVQEANSRVSQQCRSRNNFIGRRFGTAGYTSIAIAVIYTHISFNFQHSDAKGNLTRPSGKCHSLSHSIDLVSSGVVDHVPSNIPASSFPARLHIIEDNDAVIRMIVKGRSPNLSHMSRTHRFDKDWLYERINVDRPSSIRCVPTTEQLTDVFDQWCTHYNSMEPSDAVVRQSSTTELECGPQLFRIILFCSLSRPPHSRCRTPTERDFESGLWEEKAGIFLIQMGLEKANAFFGARRRRIRRFFCQETQLGGTNGTTSQREEKFEALWKSIGKRLCDDLTPGSRWSTRNQTCN